MLYWTPPAADEMESAGVTVEDYASPEDCYEAGIYYDLAAGDWRFELWAENWPALHLFNQLSTQWRVGAAGPVGLDYNVLFHELDRRELAREDYDDLLGSIRVIEGVALAEMRKE